MTATRRLSPVGLWQFGSAARFAMDGRAGRRATGGSLSKKQATIVQGDRARAVH